jgi:hypothetical protein
VQPFGISRISIARISRKVIIASKADGSGFAGAVLPRCGLTMRLAV